MSIYQLFRHFFAKNADIFQNLSELFQIYAPQRLVFPRAFGVFRVLSTFFLFLFKKVLFLLARVVFIYRDPCFLPYIGLREVSEGSPTLSKDRHSADLLRLFFSTRPFPSLSVYCLLSNDCQCGS